VTPYSVDGALAILKEWRHAQSGDAQPEKTSGKRKMRSARSERETAELKHKLSAAAAYIRFLEARLAKVKSAAGDKDRSKIDAARLDDMAQRLGWNFRDLLNECESPANFPFVSAA
jgi:hypothetical protein